VKCNPKIITITNAHWARVVGYGPFSLYVIHKEGLYPSSEDINKLMMMMMIMKFKVYPNFNPHIIYKRTRVCAHTHSHTYTHAQTQTHTYR
jgi:hypothetical protein